MEGLGAWVLTAVLDFFGEAYPRNGNEIVIPSFREVHRCTAVGTEVTGNGGALVSYSYELLGLTLDDDALGAKPPLR